MYCTLFSLGKSLKVWMQKVLILYPVNVHHPIHYNLRLLNGSWSSYQCSWLYEFLGPNWPNTVMYSQSDFPFLIFTLKWQHVVDTSQYIYNVSIFYLIYKMHYCASIFQMIVFCLHPQVLSMLFSAFLCRFQSKLFKGQQLNLPNMRK